MRRKSPSPIPPFDEVPESVVEAARRLFDLVIERRDVTAAPTPCGSEEDPEDTTGL